jgi:ATP-dependent DNA helicase 2 subunit 2
VPAKAKGRRQKESAKPISGLDVDALLGKRKRSKISPENAVAEFKQLLAAAEEVLAIEDAAKQMGQIVRSLICDSTGDLNYDRAAENMRVMREELIDYEEPDLYNKFLRDLKVKILSGELNGDRREMWWKIKSLNLGLITQTESEASEVKESEAKEVGSFRRAQLPILC